MVQEVSQPYIRVFCLLCKQNQQEWKKKKKKTNKKYSLTSYILKLIGESIVTVCM